ncbi:MAG: hypothetical protein Q7S01_03135 [bacterium]|nr:hypothetical protein [bacterium]
MDKLQPPKSQRQKNLQERQELRIELQLRQLDVDLSLLQKALFENNKVQADIERQSQETSELTVIEEKAGELRSQQHAAEKLQSKIRETLINKIECEKKLAKLANKKIE